MAKIAFTVFGTAGDVLPCIRTAMAMRDAGHEVVFVTPRWLSLYPRMAGFAAATAGDGTENEALVDTSMYSTSFSGLKSWRASMVRYVWPLLCSEFDQFRTAMTRIKPDLVVTTAQGYWGPLIATELGIPWRSLHLYPQLLELQRERSGRPPSHFALPLARWLQNQEKRLGVEATNVPVIDWGAAASGTVLAHDPCVYQAQSSGPPCCGFPYWDALFERSTAVLPAIDFAGSSGSPLVIVSLGSFIGLIDSHFWLRLATIAEGSDLRWMLVGVGESTRVRLGRLPNNVRAFPHLPLSRVISHASLLVHHGGIGSMYAALSAGVPALVAPHAFDQLFNVVLLEHLGVGQRLGSDPLEWRNLIEGWVFDKEKQKSAMALATRLRPPETAAKEIASRLLEDAA